MLKQWKYYIYSRNVPRNKSGRHLELMANEWMGFCAQLGVFNTVAGVELGKSFRLLRIHVRVL